jgi:hypothetical protein
LQCSQHGFEIQKAGVSCADRSLLVTRCSVHAVKANQLLNTAAPQPNLETCLPTCIECDKLLSIALLVPATEALAAWAGSRVHGSALASAEGTVGTLN